MSSNSGGDILTGWGKPIAPAPPPPPPLPVGTIHFASCDRCMDMRLAVIYIHSGLKHPGMVCNWCLEEIFGSLWKCSNCFDYHLCTACYMAGKHSVIHKFERIDTRDKTKRWGLIPFGQKHFVLIVSNNCDMF